MFAVLALCASLAYADEPSTLSVVVSDAKGNRVHSLTRGDFQIVTRGAKNEITEFTDGHATPRSIVVLFDLTSISMAARNTIIEALHNFLTASMRPGDRVILLTAGQALTPVSSWTAEKKEIDAALERISTSSAPATMGGDRAAAEKRIREMITDIQQATRTFYNFDTLLDAVRVYASACYRDGQQAIGLLSATIDLFPAKATRNVLIIAGGGLPVRAGADMFQYMDSVKAQAEQGQLGGALRVGAARSSPLSETNSYDLGPILHAFTSLAWSRGVAIYAIDSEMSEGPSSQVESQRTMDRAASFTTLANRSAGYQVIADETGGLAILAQRPAEALAQILADLDSFYSIRIRTTAPLAAHSALDIRSKPGYKVRFTSGGTIPPPDTEVRGRVIAHHLIKPDTNDLGISLQAAAPVGDGDKRRVALKVMIPIKNLKFVQEGDQVTGGFTVYIATGDSAGHASPVNKQSQQLRWPVAALQAAGDRQLTFAVDVVLDPGRTQISVGVLDEKSQATGYERVSI